jgi:hypothetical protein
MKVTAWTNEEYARKHYIDPFDERLNLMNPNKKMITPNELVEMAKSKGISNEEMYQIWSDVNDKIPTWIDEDKAKEYDSILIEMQECVINHCKEKGIRFSSDYHQYGCGIPLIDNKYMFFCTLREWGRIMSECDDDYSDKGYLKYYLHGNEHPTKYPNEVGEICIE